MNTKKTLKLAVLDYPSAQKVQEKTSVLAVTGHMIDSPGRKESRFPDTLESLAKAKNATLGILEQLNNEQEIFAILMGGTHGFDRIVMEWALDNAVRVHQFRPYNEKSFLDNAITAEGSKTRAHWQTIWQREHESALVIAHEPVIKSTSKQNPSFKEVQAAFPDNPYACFVDVNFQILNTLAQADTGKARVLSLWDGKGGDSPGGTEHLLTSATRRGAQCYVFNTGVENCAETYPRDIIFLNR